MSTLQGKFDGRKIIESINPTGYEYEKAEIDMMELEQKAIMAKNQKSNNKSKKHTFTKCEICKKKMLKVDGCSVDTINIEGKTFERIKVGDVYDLAEGIEDEEFRCHDCNAKKRSLSSLGMRQ